MDFFSTRAYLRQSPTSQPSQGKTLHFHPLRLNLPVSLLADFWDYTLSGTLPLINRPTIQFLFVRTWILTNPSFRFPVTQDTLGFVYEIPVSGLSRNLDPILLASASVSVGPCLAHPYYPASGPEFFHCRASKTNHPPSYDTSSAPPM